ncbi:WD40 repeat domain-containing protein [Haliangium ochraceum]|uniref:WD-40 repeat protein n=1 Tax=Haliangium ochraceum (strain DSM 14365 / JCM 11303 / SMP-2) TaxID=502025 RepID=D0LNI8_HALO1|nr:WD40 repeat domain-containing protein [Haliangium ochraceum]ACY16893.1 WD-40 repeat protein [Haliangium ochraceum DSM 14365]
MSPKPTLSSPLLSPPSPPSPWSPRPRSLARRWLLGLVASLALSAGCGGSEAAPRAPAAAETAADPAPQSPGLHAGPVLGEAIPTHESGVVAMALSSGGTRAYVAVDEPLRGELRGPWGRIWDLERGVVVGGFGEAPVRSAVLSPAGDELVTAERDGYVRRWRRDGSLLASAFVGDDLRWAASLGERLLTARDSGGLMLRERAGGRRWLLRDRAELSALVLSEGGALLALGYRDGAVEVLVIDAFADDAPATSVARIEVSSAVHALGFSPSGQRLAIGLVGAVELYDLSADKLAARLSTSSGWPVRAVAVLADDVRVAVGGTVSGQELRLWNSATGEVAYARGLDGLPRALAARGSRLLSADSDGDLRQWPTQPQARDFTELRQARGHVTRLSALGFAADGALWSRDLSGTRRWSSALVAGHPDAGTDANPGADDSARPPPLVGALVAVSPSGRRAATVEDEHEMRSLLRVYDLTRAPPEPIYEHVFRRSGTRQVVFSGDDSTLLLVDPGGQLALVSLANGSPPVPVPGFSDCSPATHFALDRSGARALIVQPLGGAEVVDLARGEVVARVDEEYLNIGALGFAADNTLLIASQSHGLQGYELNSGALRTFERGDDGRPQGTADVVLAGALSPDGRLFVGGHLSGRVSLWSLPQGVKLGEERVHPALISAVAVDTQGGRAASADKQGVIRLWSLSAPPAGR